MIWLLLQRSDCISSISLNYDNLIAKALISRRSPSLAWPPSLDEELSMIKFSILRLIPEQK